MVRRKAAAIAGAAAVTTFAATVGLGANFGLFGLTQPDSGMGHLGGARAISAVQPAPAVTATVVPVKPAMPDD
ncbi:MAG TPA: hypothetical protein VFZ17_02550 [Acidimicrobiia bacterium]|nr:hypothetical protein [Acidimicrobiia bacterium]